MLPVFPIRWVLIALPALLVVSLLVAALQAGLKNQGVAWFLTALMVVAAVFIGLDRSPLNNPVPEPMPAPSAAPPQASQAPASQAPIYPLYVRDDAGVLSNQTEETLNARNQRLYERYGVVIGVVTCNYGGDDLWGFALRYGDDMGIGSYDFIVALDISGDNYWLVQGEGLTRDFTNDDCSNYAWDYMESWFAAGDYDNAVLDLTEALEVWCGNHYG